MVNSSGSLDNILMAPMKVFSSIVAVDMSTRLFSCDESAIGC